MPTEQVTVIFDRNREPRTLEQYYIVLTEQGGELAIGYTYDPAADYGRCDQNVTNSFNGFVTYDLPFGRGRTFGSDINRVAG